MDSFDSFLKDIVPVVVGWILGIFTQSIAKDIDAREKCLKPL